MASLLVPPAALRRSALLSYLSISPVRAAPHRLPPIKAVSPVEPQKETPAKSSADVINKPAPSSLPKKPVYSMKKGQIVRVDKEKYLNSINYLSVGHPPYYKGLDYIYEDRGEVLDMRIFVTGEHALVAWVGIPTAPAWLPTDMLIKVRCGEGEGGEGEGTRRKQEGNKKRKTKGYRMGGMRLMRIAPLIASSRACLVRKLLVTRHQARTEH
ncbi:NAD(P)H:quinone oxidoreductase [Canna indica]|uniref:NAD(P)H:quinone oxidoreductase n=1 Tax=Canna indica TaxID=4628 RepID=A0AAQ3QA63_9LILI|nr:NAD(P)H:quinone oxidoreductase [Canna indica]